MKAWSWGNLPVKETHGGPPFKSATIVQYRFEDKWKRVTWPLLSEMRNESPTPLNEVKTGKFSFPFYL